MLGSFATFDCPASMDLTAEQYKELKREAFDFLDDKFSKIGGRVFKFWNPHDFGAYLSFEVDYPKDLENIEEDDGTESFIKEEWLKKEEWENEAEKIRSAYSKKFNKYL